MQASVQPQGSIAPQQTGHARGIVGKVRAALQAQQHPAKACRARHRSGPIYVLALARLYAGCCLHCLHDADHCRVYQVRCKLWPETERQLAAVCQNQSMKENLYEAIGVRDDAPEAVINAACRAMVEHCYASLDPLGDSYAEKIALIRRARTILLNNELRAEYDSMLKEMRQISSVKEIRCNKKTNTIEAASINTKAAAEEPANPTDTQKNASAFQRFIVRVIDNNIAIMVAASIFLVLGGSLDKEISGFTVVFLSIPSDKELSYAFSSPEMQIYYPCLIFIGIIFDSVLYCIFGTTLARFLVGIKIIDTKGNKLSSDAYVKRNFAVFFKGFGAGIPVIGLFAMAYEFDFFRKNGGASYDGKSGIKVIRTRNDNIGVFIALFLFIVLLFFSAIISSL